MTESPPGGGAPPPAHHAPGGGFRDPWPEHPDAGGRTGGFLRWRVDRLKADLPPDPAPEDVPRGEPDPARPRCDPGEIRITWVGHATFLLQVGGLSLLTDPVFSERVSPVPWAGPRRFSEPGLTVDRLPPLDAVLLSHDHYDHLDRPSVDALRDRYGPELPWITPLGYADWFAGRGVSHVVELDWWEETELGVPGVSDGRSFRVVCLPARHWTRRRLTENERLWSSWAVVPGRGAGRRVAAGEPRGVYFCGDSGWCPAFREIGERMGPFRASLLPIGAYEPRWFMAPAHMNPEEAVRAWEALGGRGAFLGMHWGAFRLTDEDPLEPPARAREAWRAQGHDPGLLHLPGIGGTVTLGPGPSGPGGGAPRG